MSDYFGAIGRWKPLCNFFVQGTPKPQPRQRHFAMKLKTGQYKARSYDPGTAEGWKAQIALAARDYLPTTPIEAPTRLYLLFLMPRPKSHYRTGKYAGELKLTAPYWHTIKPDIDNLQKAVMDTLSQINFWHDDDLVCVGQIFKRYTVPGESSGLKIEIKLWKGMER